MGEVGLKREGEERKVMLIKNKTLKYSREYSNKINKPAGLIKLEQIYKDDINKIYIGKELTDILSDINILKEIYINIIGDKDNNKEIDKLRKDIRTGLYKFKSSVIPTDEIIIKVIIIILEAIYNKPFKDTLYPQDIKQLINSNLLIRKRNRLDLTLNYIKKEFGGIKWIIEGDLTKYLDKSKIFDQLKLRIKDQVFIDILYKTKNSIRIEELSSILTNIYLQDLDLYLKELKESLKIEKISYIREKGKIMIGLERLEDSIEIREKIKIFLKERLKLKIENINITINNKVNFLDFEINLKKKEILTIPIDNILNSLKDKGYTKDKISGTKVGRLIHYTDKEILIHYSSLWRGLSKYYKIGSNYNKLYIVYYILTTSCLFTLISKNKLLSKKKGILKYGSPIKIGTYIFPSFL